MNPQIQKAIVCLGDDDREVAFVHVHKSCEQNAMIKVEPYNIIYNSYTARKHTHACIISCTHANTI